MTLFAYLATPLFVLAVAGHALARGQSDGWALLYAYTTAGLLAIPLYPLFEMLAATFPPLVQPRLQYARLLAVDHGLPLIAAAAATLGIHWYRRRRHEAGAPDAITLLAGMGGFFSVYAVLDQFANHADPSTYRLVLLPMLRLAAVAATAYLLTRAARGAWWWAAAMPAIPCGTAGIAYAGTLQQPDLAAVGGAALLAACIPLVFANSVSEAPDESSP
ncbi:MAG: hypothetical protein OXJ62_11260 [Spirochaetaceae bacterium]|nr:hypothetical protein [Spirochaetaceae bacterium]